MWAILDHLKESFEIVLLQQALNHLRTKQPSHVLDIGSVPEPSRQAMGMILSTEPVHGEIGKRTTCHAPVFADDEGIGIRWVGVVSSVTTEAMSRTEDGGCGQGVPVESPVPVAV